MVAKLSGSVAHYYHQDALGSVRLVTNPAVEITFGSNYVPFGASVNSTGAEAFMYTGKPVDDATGLYYFGARFYDPTIHRFITQDRNVGQIGDPISVNRYIYARDNPLAFKDPDGNNPISNWWGGLSSQQQAWVVTSITIAIAAIALIATVFFPVLAPLARSAAFGAIGAIAYTTLKGEKATAAGAAIYATSNAISTGIGSTFTSVAATTPVLKTLSTLGASALYGEVNALSQATEHSLAGEEIDIEPIGVLSSMILPTIPTQFTTMVSTGLEGFFVLIDDVINIEGDCIENNVMDLLNPSVDIEPEWENLNIFF